MKEIEKLTADQESLMPKVVKEYTDEFFKLNRITRPQFEEGVKWLYEELLKKPNPRVIYVDSWLAAIITKDTILPFMKSVRDQVRNQVGSQVWSQVWSQVGSQVWDQVRNQVWAQVGAQVGDQVGDQVGSQVWAQVRNQVEAQVGSQVWAQVRNQVEAQVWAQVWAQVGSQVWDQVRDQVWDQSENRGLEFSGCSDYLSTISNLHWVCFYDYMSRIGVKLDEKFFKYKSLILSGVFQAYEFENLVIAVEPPTEIHRNTQGQLHNINGAAVLCADGYAQYFILGRPIHQHHFEDVQNKTMTMEKFLKEKNEEQKSVIIAMMDELHGGSYVVDFFKEVFKEVDTYVDKKLPEYLVGTTGGMNIGVYTLFGGEINGESVKYVRCYCPSTDRLFFLGVEPQYNNAKDAIASLYRIPRKLSKEIKYLQRQGERFSTVLTDKGKEILESMTEQEIRDTTTITGDEYFSKMRYEF